MWSDKDLTLLRRSLREGWDHFCSLLEREPDSGYFRDQLTHLQEIQSEVQAEIDNRLMHRTWTTGGAA